VAHKQTFDALGDLFNTARCRHGGILSTPPGLPTSCGRQPPCRGRRPAARQSRFRGGSPTGALRAAERAQRCGCARRFRGTPRNRLCRPLVLPPVGGWRSDTKCAQPGGELRIRALVLAPRFTRRSSTGSRSRSPTGPSQPALPPQRSSRRHPFGATLVNKPLGALKQVPGKATRARCQPGYRPTRRPPHA
jgi:hypothetical protein